MLAIVTALLVTGAGSSMAQACARAAVASVAVIALAPAARLGYLAYPASFAAWAFAFRSVASDDQSQKAEGLPVGEQRA